jgi:dihydrodipicolinate synthase/N-acetylneuraminate lyase
MMEEDTTRAVVGLLPLMPLPLLDDQSIDLDGIAWNIHLVSDAAAPGFIMFGSMGQMANVSEAEFDLVCEAAVSTGKALGLAVVIGTTAQSQQEAIRRSQVADQAGADAVMLAPPYVLPLIPKWVVSFYADVAGAMSHGTGIMVYNYPPLTGMNITPELWASDLLNNRAITGVKESNAALPHYDEVLRTIADRVNFFSAPEPAFYHASTLGAAGVTGIFCWAALRAAVRFVDACREGRHTEPWVRRAYEAFQAASATMRRSDMPLMLSFEHAYLNAIVEFGGGHAGPPRKPYETLPVAALDRLHAALIPLRELEEELR